MAKKRKEQKFILGDEGRAHRPKVSRFHIAQEFAENSQMDHASEMVRCLLPRCIRSATGGLMTPESLR